MTTFSIVIPIFNRLAVTQEGLKSLNNALEEYKKTGQGSCLFNIVIVDDGSTDGSSAWISANYPAIHLLQGGDLWWSGSINLGARYAVETVKSQYVILWNDDTTCDSSFFSELEKIYLSGDQYRSSILVSKILWQDKPDTLFNFGCTFNRKTGHRTLIGTNEEHTRYRDVIPVDWSGGMGTVIPSPVLTAVDYFDVKNFPQYHGDCDFFLRAQDKGFKAFAVPSLKIWNNHETSGIRKPSSFSDLKRALYSNRSLYNLKQNYTFNQRHSNNTMSWAMLFYTYIVFIALTFKKMVWS